MLHALRYFKALSDETRLRLLHILNTHELSVNELVSLLEMGQSRVSRHLKVLAEEGLLVSRRDGLWAFYSATRDGEARAFLDAVLPFVVPDSTMQADMDMAARILEERACKTRQFFNSIAEDWDELNREVMGDFDLGAAVCDAMPAQCRIATDLGCGTGAVLERMLTHTRQLIGVDGSPRMLELCRRRFAGQAEKHVSLRIGELDHLPLRDGEADFACINLVLHHLSEPKAALAEIRRVLAPQGLLFIADFDHHQSEYMRTDFGDRWLGFSRATLEEYLQGVGFTHIHLRHRPVEKGLALHLALAQNL